MADKEILYRIEFEGAKEQFKALADIKEELKKIEALKDAANDDDKVRAEELKVLAKQEKGKYRKLQQAIKDQANAQKAVAGSLEDLRIKARQYTKELEKLPIGTKEFANQANKVELVNRQIRNADKSAGNFKTNIGNYAGSIGDAFQGIGINVGKLTGSLGAATLATGPLGAGLAIVAGAAQLFGTAISATDNLADKFAITMEKAKAASQVFFKALAEGDFSNFLINIREAIKEGERYAKTIDYLEDAQRGASVTEAAYRLQIAKLKIEMRDASKSDEQRIAAIRQIVDIETKIGEERLRIAKIDVENELKNKSVLNQINKDKLRDLIQNFSAYEKQFEFVEKLQDAEKRLDAERAKRGQSTSSGAYGTVGINKADEAEIKRLEEVVNRLTKATANYSDEVNAFGRISAPERQIVAEKLIAEYEAEAYATEATTRAQVTLGSLMKETFGEKSTIPKGVKAVTEEVVTLNTELQYQINLMNEFVKITDSYLAKVERSKKAMGVKFAPEDEQNVPDDNPQYVARVGVDIQATMDAASMFVNVWTDAYAMKDEALKQSLEKGLISEKQYTEESAKLQKKANNLQRLSVIAQLSGDLAKTLSALGVGAANTAKVGFPLNVPLLIAFAAQAVGILSNLKSIKFAEGGLIAGGKPHSQGGTHFVGSDGSAFEAEQGEYIAVVNKHDTKRLGELSNLNSRHGRSFYGQPQASYFAAGGVFSPNQNIGAGNQDAMIRNMIAQIGSIPVEVSLNEIEKKSDLKRKVNAIGSL